MRTWKLVIAGFLLSLMLTAPALAAGGADAPRQATPSDEQVRAAVERKLAGLDLPASSITVAVEGGTVTLSGTVPSLWAKQEAIDRARSVDEVTSVIADVSVARAESDAVIANEVAKRLQRYVFYTVFDDVDAAVRDGVVTLEGRVTMPYKVSEMANLVSRVSGVQAVENRISTLPVSPFDDQLRMTIASRIYRDPLFWNYAIQAVPPLHIIVENGRVTLTGVVNSEVERRKAEAIARTTFGVFDVTNALRLDRERPTTE